MNNLQICWIQTSSMLIPLNPDPDHPDVIKTNKQTRINIENTML